ncbi:ATP-grasp domain-containing protein [Clostridium sp. Marseille-P299]|uniref:ATP-grasp domain-containing protein n=1 Tax=Clostridium sp. Marseille-P299 TaxID=1805477 RepID=UPI0008379663|nr:ATP-grasp domain-containing protein [Clostridium sp. Marseille-P299]
MLHGWLIYSKEDSIKNEWLINEYIREGKELGISIELLLTDSLEFGVKDNTWFVQYKDQEMNLPDFAIVRTIYPLLNRQLEMMGVSTYNNSKVAEICNDKAKTYQYVAQLKIPMVDTRFCRKHELVKRISKLEDKSVVKSVSGHGGSEVFLVENQTYDKEITDIDSNFVIQPLVGSKHQDLRVYVLGDEILACVLRTAKEGFKSNFSLGGDVCLYELSKEEEEVVKRIISMFDFGLVGIDFIVADDNTLLFNEIEDVVGARMLYQCKDINLAKMYLEFIKLKEMKKM